MNYNKQQYKKVPLWLPVLHFGNLHLPKPGYNTAYVQSHVTAIELSAAV